MTKQEVERELSELNVRYIQEKSRLENKLFELTQLEREKQSHTMQKEDEEEFLKYGNITKIFKFPFVCYNDFLRGKTIEVENVVSAGKATKFDCIVICDMVKGKQQIIDHATRENYHKALEYAINLFLGE